jgi:hypothetical protein
MRVVIASLLVLGYVSATPAATESTCAANCFGQTCDFWVAQWGLDCKTVEKEYACSCSGCACQSTADTLGRTHDRRATNTTGNGTVATTYKVTAAVSLAGITAAQFDSKAQTGFKNAIGSTFNKAASDVTITSFARRAVAIKFAIDYGTSKPDPTAVTNANGVLGGATFKSTLNTAMTAAGSSAVTTGVTVTQAPATVANVNSATSAAGLSLAAVVVAAAAFLN